MSLASALATLAAVRAAKSRVAAERVHEHAPLYRPDLQASAIFKLRTGLLELGLPSDEQLAVDVERVP